MQLHKFDNPNLASEAIANLVITRIQAFSPTQQRKFVLCLPTGSSPIEMYKELARRCKLGHVSFEFVLTFNLDEYVGLGPADPQSYHAFMEREFFSKVDLPPSNQNLFYGLAVDLQAECARYEAKLQSVGGIDLLIAGIGENGHLAFNEPGCSLGAGCGVVALDEGTREANARFFDDDIEKVPTHALTMGIASIMAAKEVALIVSGEKKAQAMKDCFQGGVNHMHPASILQLHPSVSIYADYESTHLLSSRTLQALLHSSTRLPNTPTSPDTPSSSSSTKSNAYQGDDGRIRTRGMHRLQVCVENDADDDIVINGETLSESDNGEEEVPPPAKLPPIVRRLNRKGGALRVITGEGIGSGQQE